MAQIGQILDPHVFPFIVKGYKDPDVVKFESRRNKIEAEQSQSRFISEGLQVWVFEVKLVSGSETPESVSVMARDFPTGPERVPVK